MDTPSVFSDLSMFTVFQYRNIAFIKMSQATDTQEGQAMRLKDGEPFKFDKQTEVVPLPY